MKSARPVSALLLFVAIVVSSFEWAILRHAFEDRGARAAELAIAADPNVELAAFLEGVRARTAPGESIALLLPPRPWDSGYSRAYFRASYLLAGREVLPVISPADRVLRENLQSATWVAAWRVRYDGRGSSVWSGSSGTLVRQR